jgi:hypothetical protein
VNSSLFHHHLENSTIMDNDSPAFHHGLLRENIQQLENHVSMGRTNVPGEIDLQMLLENIRRSLALIDAVLDSCIESFRKHCVMNAESEARLSANEAASEAHKAQTDARFSASEARLSALEADIAALKLIQAQNVYAALVAAVESERANAPTLILDDDEEKDDDVDPIVEEAMPVGVQVAAVDEAAPLVVVVEADPLDVEVAALVANAAPLVIEEDLNAWETAAAAVLFLDLGGAPLYN